LKDGWTSTFCVVACDNVKYFTYDNKFKDTSKSQIVKFRCSNVSLSAMFYLWWDLDTLHETDVVLVHGITNDSSSQIPINMLTDFLMK
jgi:hypothetical protein